MKELNEGPRHAQVVKLEKKEMSVKDSETAFEVK